MRYDMLRVAAYNLECLLHTTNNYKTYRVYLAQYNRIKKGLLCKVAQTQIS